MTLKLKITLGLLAVAIISAEVIAHAIKALVITSLIGIIACALYPMWKKAD
jgi:hypothetical protein